MASAVAASRRSAQRPLAPSVGRPTRRLRRRRRVLPARAVGRDRHHGQATTAGRTTDSHSRALRGRPLGNNARADREDAEVGDVGGRQKGRHQPGETDRGEQRPAPPWRASEDGTADEGQAHGEVHRGRRRGRGHPGRGPRVAASTVNTPVMSATAIHPAAARHGQFVSTRSPDHVPVDSRSPFALSRSVAHGQDDPRRQGERDTVLPRSALRASAVGAPRPAAYGGRQDPARRRRPGRQK